MNINSPLDPAALASDDQARAEFKSLGITFTPGAPIIACIAIDLDGTMHSTIRPGMSLEAYAELLHRYADFVAENGLFS
ncbi:MAG: hypothetical protein LCH36_00280 [Actinobacteria bacterium]|nr:hypothetical protein [Actinomycetota bacterium]